MANSELEFKIKLLDQFGKPIDKLQKKVGDFSKANKKLNGEINKSLSDLRTQLSRYRQASESSYRTDHIEKYKKLIAQTQKEIKVLEDKTKTCTDKTEGFGRALTKVGIAGIALKKASDVVDFGVRFGKESVQADAQMQKYSVTLKTMLGSTSAARDRMQEYMNLAKQTPFELSEVVEGGNKLQAIGKYSQGNLKMLGDLAAASGKPLEQVLNAYSKLSTGQKGEGVNMFRDLLISTDDWVKATGKGIAKNGELKASTEEMLAVLPKIMKSKGYFGMMASQAETTGGAMSNLEDNIFGLKTAIGEKLRPSTDAFISTSNKVVDSLTKWVEIPLEEKIAKEKSEVNYLMNALIEEFPHEEKRQSLIAELNRKYPELLKNLDLEKTSTAQLRDRLEEVNKQYDKKMRVAVYQRMINDLNSQSESDVADMADYRRSLMAKQELQKLKDEWKNYAVNTLGISENSTLGIIGKATDKRGQVDRLNLNKRSPEQVAEINRFRKLAETYRSQANFFANEPEKLKELELKDSITQEQIDKIQKLIDGETPPPDSGTGGNTGDSNGTDKGLTDLEKSANSISAGGKQVKNFNIVINDGLIKQVDNHFSSSSDSPESASNFMWQLSQALQMILNDVNYAAT